MNSSHISAVTEALEIDAKFGGFTPAEAAFVARVLASEDAEVFIELMGRANEAGVCNGIAEERSNAFLR